MVKLTACIILVFCIALVGVTWAEPDLKNGPSGFQTFKGNKAAKTIAFKHNNNSAGNVYDGKGSVSGKTSQLTVDGQKLEGKVQGQKTIATRNGKQATAEESSKNSFKAEREGKTATADTEGNKLKSAKAGLKHISGAYDKASESAKAKNENGGETWDADLTKKKGTAVDNESGKKATLNGIAKGTRKVVGQADRKKILAGRSGNKAKTAYSYAQFQQKTLLGTQRTRYTAQQKTKGRTSHHTRIVKGKRNQVYESSVNNKNEASLHERSGRKLATIKAKRYTDVPCDRLKHDIFRKDSDDFIFHNETLKVTYPKKNGGYSFPSCMDISTDVTLPKGVHVKDLAGALTVILPGCGEFTCGTGTKCLSHNCFYKSLCPPKDAKPSQDHKDAANYILSQTDHNACDDNFPAGGRVTINFKYCPDVEADVDQKTVCEKTLTSTVAVASMQTQIDLWSVKSRPMGCNINNPKDVENVRKLGCKRILIDYQVKWKNVPDFAGLSTQAGKLLDKANCNLGKRPCVGHDKLDVLGLITGKRNGGGSGGLFGGLLGGRR